MQANENLQCVLEADRKQWRAPKATVGRLLVGQVIAMLAPENEEEDWWLAVVVQVCVAGATHVYTC